MSCQSPHWRNTLLHDRRRLIYLYVSVGNVSNMSQEREEVQIKKQYSIGEMLTLVETTSKTTLDLGGDFHLLFIYFHFFFRKSNSFSMEREFSNVVMTIMCSFSER